MTAKTTTIDYDKWDTIMLQPDKISLQARSGGTPARQSTFPPCALCYIIEILLLVTELPDAAVSDPRICQMHICYNHTKLWTFDTLLCWQQQPDIHYYAETAVSHPAADPAASLC